ncbi:MAG: DUF1552 domain-containing protein [Zavarzinella sp.]
MNIQALDRRTVLKGIGAAIAIPWLEAMAPQSAWANPGSAPKIPNRLAFLYVPNGVNMADWTPKAEGKLSAADLPAILKPLEKHLNNINVLTNLTADKARAHGDGGGDHARALAAFLTGCQPRKTDGLDIRAGISVDQVAAGRIGHQTRLPSIEIGAEGGAMAGNCDSGYSCVYSSTMSWKSGTQPLPKEINPKLVFERLFGNGNDAARAERDAKRKSILDFIKEDSSDLTRKLGTNDQRKLNEYFSALRDVEVRIAQAEKLPPVKAPDQKAPTGIPANYEEHLQLLADLLVLAFQADVTRVATYVFANEGSNKPYPFIGVREGHHDLSHHENKQEKKDKIRQINEFHTKQLAYFLTRLQNTPEGAGTLLDHAMVAYGSGNSDGNAHNHDNLPIVMAGRAGGKVSTGRHLIYGKETPLNNLWLALLQRLDVQLEQLGDSTGILNGLN